ncbi:GNAT family N-acetyltransferase [Pseudoxanthomonas putridarboris]|uniref:GNAT family N-acetyltransferase n=1 Tax=Pseudoxanthomonas putridarboris TaxID=752605 RepID=A0ABU9IZ79_9GAMM
MPLNLRGVASASPILDRADDDPMEMVSLPVASNIRVVRVTRAHASVLMAMCDQHAAERGPPTPSRRTVLELMEALFEPPMRAWAWLAEYDGEPAGYAFATAGFSMLERAYYLNLEALFVPVSRRPSGIASALLTQARRMADEMGCVELRWQVPLWHRAERIALPGQGDTGAVAMVQYVFPALERDAHAR